MMTGLTTPRLSLPLLAPGQAQKEMSHNEALARLDLAAQAAVIAVGTNISPTGPEPGQAWIVGTEPEGEWTGQAGAIAGWTEGGWRFLSPREGMRAWVAEGAGFALFTSGAWKIGNAHGRLIVDGEQVVGPRAGPIAEPAGGATIDAEARAAIASILAAIRGHGLIDSG